MDTYTNLTTLNIKFSLVYTKIVWGMALGFSARSDLMGERWLSWHLEWLVGSILTGAFAMEVSAQNKQHIPR